MKCDCEGRTYELIDTSYVLCIECGCQYPMIERVEHEV